ncbi:MAG: methyltransferase domain-containing protein [Patescibacteria group bacterium]
MMEKFPYEKAEQEEVPCGFCGSRDLEVLAEAGQDGLPLRTVICRVCGLVFINPRMTREWYARYYQEEYRTNTIGNIQKKPPDFDKLFVSMTKHGEELAEFIQPYLKVAGLVAEVGSSLGGILAGIKNKLNREVVGIEPSQPEVDYANRQGVKSICSLVETLDEKFSQPPKFGVVICSQSLNHFLEPRIFFSWAHKHLLAGGLLVLEVMNFRHQLKKAGRFRNAVKIDHVQMFTPEVLKNFVEAAGFDILYFDVDETKSQQQLNAINRVLPKVHITCVARKTSRPPFENFAVVPNYQRVRRTLNKLKIYLYYLFAVRLPRLDKKSRSE